MLCSSDNAAGLGTKMVLRTSRRPRSVLLRLGCAACYDRIRPRYPQNMDGLAYRTQGVNDAGHGSVIVLALFLDRGVADVELELGCRVGVTTLGTARLLVHYCRH